MTSCSRTPSTLPFGEQHLERDQAGAGGLQAQEEETSMTAPVSPLVVPGPAELPEAAPSWTAERSAPAVAQRGAWHLALAAGETPRRRDPRRARPPHPDRGRR